jgi:hypothetical protein
MDGAHTHGGGGGFAVVAALVIFGAVIANALRQLIGAVIGLLDLIMITAGAALTLGAVITVALAVTRRRRAPAVPRAHVLPSMPAPPPAPPRAVIEQHVHHHWHVTPDEMGALMRGGWAALRQAGAGGGLSSGTLPGQPPVRQPSDDHDPRPGQDHLTTERGP